MVTVSLQMDSGPIGILVCRYAHEEWRSHTRSGVQLFIVALHVRHHHSCWTYLLADEVI